jgi:hypothetical protein
MRRIAIDELAEVAQLVVGEVISEAEAIHRAEVADWEWVADDIFAVVETISVNRCEGDLKSARALACLLLAAMDRQQPEFWPLAAMAYLQVATEVVARDLDGPLYRQACAVAARLLPDADAEALRTIAHLKLEPFAFDPVLGAYPHRESWRRARLGLLLSGFTEGTEMPSPEEPLTEARGLFAALAERLTGAEERGSALVQQAYAVFSLGRAGGPAAVDECLALCVEAWPLVGEDPLASTRVYWMLASYSGLNRVTKRPMFILPPDELMASYGPRITAAVVATAVLLSRGKRALAHALCEQILAQPMASGFESRRAWFADFRAHVLPNDPTDCKTVADRPVMALVTGRIARWTNAQVVEAMLHSLAHATTEGLLEFPELSEDQTELRNRLLAGYKQRIGDRLVSEQEHAAAVPEFILAAGLHAGNGNPEAAGHCLQLATECARVSHAAAHAAVDELAKWAGALVESLGPQGARALDELYRTCFGHLHTDGEPLPLLTLMQLAKGRATAQIEPRRRPVLLCTLMLYEALCVEAEAGARLPRTEIVAAPEPESRLIDGHLFLGAYLLEAELQPGRTPAEEFANLRRRCQHIDMERISMERGSTPLPTDREVLAQLPRDAVLVSMYEGPIYDDGEPGIVFDVETTESSMEITGVYRDSPIVEKYDYETRTSESGFTRRIRFSTGGARSAHVRRLLLEDPLNRPVSREAESALAGQAGAGAFHELLKQLATLHNLGKRQLVLWPHGAYHFFPFHLLPTGDGRILADDWTVVLVPTLRSIARVTEHRGRDAVLAMASSDGGTQYGLAAEPDVIRQTQAIAAVFGIEPVAGSAATVDRFMSDAEQARFIHLAAHGAHYSPAPLFDSIFLTDRPLFAHDVLRLDLAGVELVTLSACESQLLRFDLSGDLHGMAAAFLRAGASAVVGALWPVRAAVAYTFFSELYSCLAQGHGKLDAFRSAQVATRELHHEFRDWAAFSILGAVWEK